MKIFILEDNNFKKDDIVEALNEYFKEGFKLEHRECLEEAVKYITENDYDLIVSDMHLPVDAKNNYTKKGAFELLKHAKKPLVIVSSRRIDDSQVESENYLGSVKYDLYDDAWRADLKVYLSMLK